MGIENNNDQFNSLNPFLQQEEREIGDQAMDSDSQAFFSMEVDDDRDQCINFTQNIEV